MQDSALCGHLDKQLPAKAPDKCEHGDFSKITLGDIQNLNQMNKAGVTVDSSTFTNDHHINNLSGNPLPTLVLDGITLTPVKTGHIVSSGETLTAIAAEHLPNSATTQEIYNYVNQIADLNHIDQIDTISQGQFLDFPDLQLGGADFNTGSSSNAFGINLGAMEAVSAGTDASNPPGTSAIGTGASGLSAEAEAYSAVMAGSAEEGTLDYYLEGFSNVAGAVFDGCVTQVTEHPLEVALAIAKGVGVAAIAVAAAPEIAAGMATYGVAITAAEVLGLGAALGTAATVAEVGSKIEGWYDAATIVAHPHGHTVTEYTSASNTLNDMSNFVVDQVTGLIDGPGSTHLDVPVMRGFEAKEEDEKKQN